MTREEILTAVKNGELEIGDATELLKALDGSAPRSLSCKVSAKGAVSVYGLNARFPVTLYGPQWDRLIEFVPFLQQFMADHKSELATDKKSANGKAADNGNRAAALADKLKNRAAGQAA